jgi:hypothetical protein
MWAAVIDEFATPAAGITVTRTAASTLGSDGFYTDGAETTIAVSPVSIQPASGKDMQLLPEGARTDETIRVYCTERLRTAATPDGVKPDRFVFDGKTWEVKTEQPWQLNNDGFFKFLAQRVDV